MVFESTRGASEPVLLNGNFRPPQPLNSRNVTRSSMNAPATAQPPMNTATAQPPMNTATVQPPMNTATVQPPMNTATVQTPMNTATVQPPMNTATVQPPMNTAMVQPPMNNPTVQSPMNVASSVAQPFFNLATFAALILSVLLQESMSFI